MTHGNSSSCLNFLELGFRLIVAANWIMGPWKGLAYEMVEAGLMVMGIMVMVMVNGNHGNGNGNNGNGNGNNGNGNGNNGNGLW